MSAVRTDRNPLRPLTPGEKTRARHWCHNTARRLTQPPEQPEQVAQELLWATGLDPDPEAKGDSHAYRKRTYKKGAST